MNRDRIAQLLLTRPDMDPPAMTPEEEQLTFGGPLKREEKPLTDEQRWGHEFRNQVPPSLTPGTGVIRQDLRGWDPYSKPERMPQVVGNGQQVVDIPNYAQKEMPSYSIPRWGNEEYPVAAEPSFEGQLSGDVPISW